MKKILIVIICMTISIVLIACSKEEDDKLTIGYFNNITHGQALIMKHEETLQKKLDNEVNVEWVAFNAGPAEVEACFAGDIDIGFIGPVPAATANIKSNGDFIIISGATNGGTVLIARKDANIRKVKDLNGKSISVPQLGNTQHLLLVEMLYENQLKPVSEGGKVNIIEAQNADVINLISNQNIDAAIVPEPWGTIIMNTVETEVVVDYDEFHNGKDYSTAVVMVNKDYMEKNSDIVKIFLEAHFETTKYIVRNSEEAGKIMNEQLDTDTGKRLEEDIITDAIARINFSCKIPETSILNYVKVSKEQGFITKEPAEAVFDDSILKKVLK